VSETVEIGPHSAQKRHETRKLTKVEMAKRMRTSRVQSDRLFDYRRDSVTLGTLRRAAAARGASRACLTRTLRITQSYRDIAFAWLLLELHRVRRTVRR
jgi:hypothetical protein